MIELDRKKSRNFWKVHVVFWPKKRVCRCSHLPSGVPLSKPSHSSKPRRIPTCSTVSLGPPKFVALDDDHRTQAIRAVAFLHATPAQQRHDRWCAMRVAIYTRISTDEAHQP